MQNKKKTVRKKATRKIAKPLPEVFKIEMIPPAISNIRTDTRELLLKVENTIKLLPVGAAFILPNRGRAAVRNYLNKKTDYLYRIVPIVPEKKFLRVYKFPINKK